MKYSLAYIAAVLSCGVAVAQEAQPVQKECCNAFKLDFATTAALYSFDSNDVTTVSEKFTFKWDDKLTFDVEIPFYNNGTETGVGDVDFSANYDFYNTKIESLNANFGFDAVFGVQVPLDGEYSSGEEVFHLGGVFDLTWEKITLSQTVEYLFVNSYTYSPIFNGLVSEDIYTGVTSLAYQVHDGMSFCLNGTQSHSGDFDSFLLGPSVVWNWKNINGHVGVDFPLNYSVKAEDLDAVVSAGIGFEF